MCWRSSKHSGFHFILFISITCLSQELHGTVWKGIPGSRLVLSPREMSHAGPHPRESQERDAEHPPAPGTSPAAGAAQMQLGREMVIYSL